MIEEKMEKQREFKIKIIEKDGKKYGIVEAESEEIIHPDGRKDVIIHAPSLELIKQQLKSSAEVK